MGSWKRDRLGNLADIRARIGWRGLSADEYVDRGPFLIAGKHIVAGSVDWDACDHLTEHRYRESPEIALQVGDVIVSKDGTIGRVARIDSLPGPATLNGTMMLVRATGSLDHRYLSHSLNGPSFRKLVEERISGSSVPHLFQRDLSTLSITLPPLEEQRRIAKILDTIDETIQATRLVIAKRRHLRAGLASDLLEVPSGTAPCTNSKPNETTPPLAWTSTPGPRTCLEGRRLSDYADLNPGSLGAATAGDLRFDYFDLSSVSDGSVIKSKVKTVTFGRAPSRARRIACKDDFLFGTVRPLQKSHAWAPGACIASTGFAVVRAKRGLASSRFIGHFLLSDESTLRADQFAVGSGYPALSEKDLGEFVLPDLTLREQQRIADILERVDSTIRDSEAELVKLRELRAGLAADLLSGRVRTVAA